MIYLGSSFIGFLVLVQGSLGDYETVENKLVSNATEESPTVETSTVQKLSQRLESKLYDYSLTDLRALDDYAHEVSSHRTLVPVPEYCREQMERFQESASHFVTCAVEKQLENSICFGCAVAYAEMDLAYNGLLVESEVSKESKPCIQYYRTSLISSADLLFKQLQTVIWNNAECDECIIFNIVTPPAGGEVNITYAVSTESEHLLNLTLEFYRCFASKEEYEPIVQVDGKNVSKCSLCRPLMVNITRDIMSFIVLDRGADPDASLSFCYDVLSQVSRAWALYRDVGCEWTHDEEPGSLATTIIVIVFIFIVTAFFYIGASLQSDRLVRRLRKYRHHLHYGSGSDIDRNSTRESTRSDDAVTTDTSDDDETRPWYPPRTGRSMRKLFSGKRNKDKRVYSTLG